VLEGETVLADALADRGAQLRDEARALASQIASDLWLEKLSVATRLPAVAVATEQSGDLAAMLAGADSDSGLAAALAADLAPFLTAAAPALPPEPDDLRQAATDGAWQRLACTAAAGLRARLASGA
jgi:hypothetical protein